SSPGGWEGGGEKRAGVMRASGPRASTSRRRVCLPSIDNPRPRPYDAADLETPPSVAKNLTPKTTILDAKQMARIIRRMAGEIVEVHHDTIPSLLLAGIRTRGVPLAEKIADEIERMEGIKV